MSAWADYNFPDIAGTDLQTALEGLMLAIKERCDAIGTTGTWFDTNSFYEGIYAEIGSTPLYNSPLPLIRAVDGIDNLFYDIPGRYMLPNGVKFSKTAAADYLGEEIIVLPSLTSSGDFANIYYEWLMQRYRMLNCCYLYSPYEYNVVSGEYYGSGDTKEEALKNYSGSTVEKNTIETPYGVHCEEIFGWSEWDAKDISLHRLFHFTSKFKYPATIPSRVFSSGKVKVFEDSESYHPSTQQLFKQTFADFGTGLKRGDEFEIDFTVSDAKKGDFVDIQSDVLSNLQKNVVNYPFPDVMPDYLRGEIRRYMDIYIPSLKLDLRPGLEFYDEIKIGEKDAGY